VVGTTGRGLPEEVLVGMDVSIVVVGTYGPKVTTVINVEDSRVIVCVITTGAGEIAAEPCLTTRCCGEGRGRATGMMIDSVAG
jgi:hypothetical protein